MVAGAEGVAGRCAWKGAMDRERWELKVGGRTGACRGEREATREEEAAGGWVAVGAREEAGAREGQGVLGEGPPEGRG